MLRDRYLADMPIVVAAIDPCFSCTDRLVAVVDADTFQQQHQVIGPRGLLVAAASLGSTRLIDNIPLTPSAYPAEDATT